MAMGFPIDISERQDSRGNIDWMPLLIVIGSLFLISSAAVYGVVSYGGYYDNSFTLETQASIALSFVAVTLFITSIASVIYQQIPQAKKLLLVGMIVVIVMFAIRTEVYLRSTI
jgi:hypothetical protein